MPTVPLNEKLRALPPLARPQKKSAAHRIALAIVWVTIASSAIVFSEPAPVDALTFGLFLLLPVVGLVDAKPIVWGAGIVLLMLAAASTFSTFLARDTSESAAHLAVTLYLYGAAFLFAAFIAKQPEQHAKLVLNAYLIAGLVAAALGIAGYLDLFPGAYDLFTKYDRAAGPFKDPNVFGPFLVAPLLTALHLWLHRPFLRGLLPLAAAGVISIAILFSFSRGAWAAAGIGVAVYSYLYLITAPRNWDRVKLAGMALCVVAILGLALAAALQSDDFSRLLHQRMSVTQPYDVGPDGRFGGQEKAVGLLLENPLGLGAQIFSRFYHHEEVHNVYLSMFLNAGWLGGLLFIAMCAGTLVLGFRHALRRTKTAPLFLIVFAALAGNVLEGVLIDSDHWRHFYLLLAIVWGLMASDRRALRRPRIVKDSRPLLLQSVLIIPPSRRSGRILGSVPKFPLLDIPANDSYPGPRAHGRIVSAHG